MKNKDIEVREVRYEDLDFLFNLRNQQYVYRYSHRQRRITYREFMEWITPILRGESKSLAYLVLYQGEKSGQLRFDGSDLGEDVREIGICVLQKYWGEGIASSSIRQGLDLMRQKGIRKILARIRAENTASLHLFEKLDFKEISAEEAYKTFEYQLEGNGRNE
ncbi:MAG: GNAT family N-acetyltransferase [Candidatus Nanoarchaeia archaeon]|nr:GNAT family N-acetyltransferase [Candidatus Nanoarchaeia archaeon]